MVAGSLCGSHRGGWFEQGRTNFNPSPPYVSSRGVICLATLTAAGIDSEKTTDHVTRHAQRRSAYEMAFTASTDSGVLT